MSTTSIPLQPIPAASAVLQPSQRPPSTSPMDAQPQPGPAASTEASNSNTEPTQATPAVQEQAPVSAAPAVLFRRWSLANVIWKNTVSLIAVIGFATAIYYALRGDATGTKGLYYTIKSWLLSAWTAEKDYCDFKRTYKNDTTCDPGPPPVIRDVHKKWQEVSVTSTGIIAWSEWLPMAFCVCILGVTTRLDRRDHLVIVSFVSGPLWTGQLLPAMRDISKDWVRRSMPNALVDLSNELWPAARFLCAHTKSFMTLLTILYGGVVIFVIRMPPAPDEEDGLQEGDFIFNRPPVTAYEKRILWWARLLVFPAILNGDVVRYLKRLGSPIFRLAILDRYFPSDEDSPYDPVVYRGDSGIDIGFTYTAFLIPFLVQSILK